MVTLDVTLSLQESQFGSIFFQRSQLVLQPLHSYIYHYSVFSVDGDGDAAKNDGRSTWPISGQHNVRALPITRHYLHVAQDRRVCLAHVRSHLPHRVCVTT